MTVEEILLRGRTHPLEFGQLCWPDFTPYNKQVDMVHSVRDYKETFVVAGNKLGKDWISGFIVPWFFLCFHPVRIVTTSVKDDHLRVLWGEMGRFIRTSRIPLRVEDGGPLIVNHREIKKVVNGKVDDISYVIGMVSERAEGLAGHHAPFTLAVVDEASGVVNAAYDAIVGWAKRILAFGNPHPPVGGFNHWWYKAIKGGDIYLDDEEPQPVPDIILG